MGVPSDPHHGRPDDEPRDPWALAEIEPTTLIGLWPGAHPPLMTEILAGFGAHLGERIGVIAEAETGDPGVLWNALVELPKRGWELAVWAEPAQTLEPGELDDPAAEACKWIIGVEGVLDPDAPLESFAALMQLVAVSFEDIPAVLDVNTRRWHPRPALNEHFGPDATPPAGVLWITHVVAPADAGEDDEATWLLTDGLARCGLPELEMIEVPGRLAGTAGELLGTLACRMLEEMLPPPGEPFPVGPGLDVTLQPWQAVAPYVSEAPGGLADRADTNGGNVPHPHAGVRAVVCAVKPQGTYRKVWRWPRTVLERIDDGEGALFLSSYETERQAKLARRAWPQLAGAFEGLAPPLLRVDSEQDPETPWVRFLIKAGLTANGDDDREHLWFVVRRFDHDRAEGELLNEPSLARTLAPGDVTWIERDRVSDWSVVTPAGSFGPADASAMSQTLASLRSRTEGAP